MKIKKNIISYLRKCIRHVISSYVYAFIFKNNQLFMVSSDVDVFLKSK